MEILPDLIIPRHGGYVGRKKIPHPITVKNNVRGKECADENHISTPDNDNWVPLDEFNVHHKKGDSICYQPICKTCSSRIRKFYHQRSWYYSHLYGTVREAKRRGIECVDIIELDIIIKNQFTKQKGRDFFSNKPMILSRGLVGNNLEVFSIDRLDRKMGYVNDNIVLCSKRVNYLKALLENLFESKPASTLKAINMLLETFCNIRED